jgi:uncharacterized protein
MPVGLGAGPVNVGPAPIYLCISPSEYSRGELFVSRINLPNNDAVVEAISYARRCLKQKLIPELTYHNLTHTFEHVLPAAMDLADRCGVTQEEKELLAVAVAFHDIGWIVQGPGHERIGARMARQKLPDFGFTNRHIERITAMILATRLPHRPTCLLERILIDADMTILTRDDFWECNRELRDELEVLGQPLSDRQWYKIQLAFLETHRYFTDVAVAEREQVKQQHILELRRRLAACEAEPDLPLNRRSQDESLVQSENDA